MVEAAPTATARYQLYKQIDRLPDWLVERLTPSKSSRLGQFLTRYGDDGRELVTDGGRDLRDLVVREDWLDEETTRALLRADARGDLNDAELQRTAIYLKQGRMDQADVRRMEEMLRTRDSDPLIADDLTGSDLLTIGSRNSNLEETLSVLKDSSGRLRWLEEGHADGGWQHIEARHRSDFLNREGISSNSDIRHSIYRTIRNGESRPDPDSGTGYVLRQGSDSHITVIVSNNGYIVTAFPGTPNWWS